MSAHRYSLLLVLVVVVAATSFLRFCRKEREPSGPVQGVARTSSPSMQDLLTLYDMISQMESETEVIYSLPTTNRSLGWSPRTEVSGVITNLGDDSFVYIDPSYMFKYGVVTNVILGVTNTSWEYLGYEIVTNVSSFSRPTQLSRTVPVSYRTSNLWYKGYAVVHGRECFQDVERVLIVDSNPVTLKVKANLDSKIVQEFEHEYLHLLSTDLSGDALDIRLFTSDRIAIANDEDWDTSYMKWVEESNAWKSVISSFSSEAIGALLIDFYGGPDADWAWLNGTREDGWEPYYVFARPYLYSGPRREIVQMMTPTDDGVTIPQVEEKVWPVTFSNSLPTALAFSSPTKFKLVYRPSAYTNEQTIQTIYAPQIIGGYVFTNSSEKVTNSFPLLDNIDVRVGGDSFLPALPSIDRWEEYEEPPEWGTETNRYVFPIMKPMTEQTEQVETPIAWEEVWNEETEEWELVPTETRLLPYSKRYDPEEVTLTRGEEQTLDYLYNLSNFYGTNSVAFYVAVTNLPVYETNIQYRTASTNYLSTNIFAGVTNIATSHTFTNTLIYQVAGPRKGDAVLAILDTEEPLYRIESLHANTTASSTYGGVNRWMPYHQLGVLDTPGDPPAVSKEWFEGLSNRVSNLRFRSIGPVGSYGPTNNLIQYEGWGVSSNSFNDAWDLAVQDATDDPITNSTAGASPSLSIWCYKELILWAPTNVFRYTVHLYGVDTTYAAEADARSDMANVVWRQQEHGYETIYGERTLLSDTLWTIGADGSGGYIEGDPGTYFTMGEHLTFPDGWTPYKPSMSGEGDYETFETNVTYTTHSFVPTDISKKYPWEE